MKKLTFTVITVGFLFLASSVEARPWIAQNNAVKNKVRDEMATKAAEFRKQYWSLKERFPFLLPSGIKEAQIVSISGNTLPAEIKATQEDKTITLKISGSTLILRKFGGKSSLREIRIGDTVSARGSWQDNDEAILDVRVLRDLSIQKRSGTFWGKIKSISGTTFVFETANRGDQTVQVDTNTAKIFNRREEKISFSDLKVGDRVRVSGVWDSTLKTIEEVRTIKNWSLPPNPTLTPTPI